MKRTVFLAAAIAATLPVAGFAGGDIEIHDAFARASTAASVSGAAFMVVENHAAQDDRLVAVSSDAAERVELHTHIETDGVMRMVEVEEGFVIPAGSTHALARGGDHVMFLGLTAPFVHGETVTVTLTFEQAGDLVVDILIDLERGVDHGHGSGGMMGH
ncbi:copper chaperone PCu(A)C [Alkalilacustris brevis]|uniref:copper chaperone PCu(A)C n=1 Tax=Alkalilacustris brevis TaxID=2026338 RepID=UPI000E0D35EC|nr:copper chaperone PCu(A)C [Alkalilacustris brevis]